mmetsp:Transcript_27264/g.45609  ORF Transcript_27264/g.45609 Transcript_27264/m.45609 type:complete len:212 (-) Transcript_27264:266-901(-)
MGEAEGLEAHPSLARACTQPRTTIPPTKFSSVEAAEAAGFDAERGRWSMPAEGLAELSVDNEVDDGVNDGMDQSKLDDVLAWYRSVPNLADSITCIAWQHRNTSPLVTVQGDTDAASVMISLLERSEWELNDNLGCAARFAQLDFHPDAHYFVWIAPGHLETEVLGVADLRLEFPEPPEQMDAWMAANSCDDIKRYSCDNIDSRIDDSEVP